ncbi:MAG: DUF58 domain-containing protein [Oscillospiraceae bacterium]|nr:DUF58 domain-containing protein [Oscillospiraceae bacterium]
MKLQRILFYLVLAASIITALYTGIRLFYIIFFVQLLLLGVVVLVNYWTLHSFRFVQSLDTDQAVKGSSVTLSVHITNETVIPLSLMTVEISVASPGKREPFSLCVPPYSQVHFDFPIDLPYRGVYKIGIEKIQITDVFGLTTLRYDMRHLPWYHMLDLTVVPRSPAVGYAAEVFDEKLFSDTGLSPASSGESISTARPYMQGDAMKRINWKVSARYGELYVKQYDTPIRESVVILLDNSSLEQEEERGSVFLRRKKTADLQEKIAACADTACECATLVARMSLMHGQTAQIHALGILGRTVSLEVPNETSLDELLLWLANLNFERFGAITKILPDLVGLGASLVVISSKPTDELIMALEGCTDLFESVGLIAIGDLPEQHGRVGVIPVPVGADVFSQFSEEVRQS